MHNNTRGYIYTDKYAWISIGTHRSMHKHTCLCLFRRMCTTWTLDSIFPVSALFTHNYLKVLFHLNLFSTCSARLCERCNHTKVLMDDNIKIFSIPLSPYLTIIYLHLNIGLHYLKKKCVYLKSMWRIFLVSHDNHTYLSCGLVKNLNWRMCQASKCCTNILDDVSSISSTHV